MNLKGEENNMLKKGLGLFIGLATALSIGTACQATIIPAAGPGQIGLSAVVLCNNLTLHQEGNATSAAVKTLNGGDRVIVMEQKDGWAQCILSDDVNAAPEGWLNTEYIAIDPAWYQTDDITSVYAWNDTNALKVDQIGKDVVLPILKDDGEWVVVALHGASGWIHKTEADLAAATPAATAAPGKQVTPTPTPAAKPTGTTQAAPFTVYAEDGSSVSIHATDGTLFTDDSGRSYSNTRGEYYYCIDTDTLYSADANVWVNGEPTPDDALTGADYGEGAGLEDNWSDYDNGYTGADYGEGAGLEDNWSDYDNGYTGADYGEGAGLEDNWSDYDNGYTGADYGEGAGLEDNWG